MGLIAVGIAVLRAPSQIGLRGLLVFDLLAMG